MCEHMSPGTDHCFSGNVQAFHKRRDCIGVRISPTVQSEYRDLYIIIIHAYGTVFPVVVSRLMPEPQSFPARHLFESSHRLLIPGLRLDIFIYGAAHICLHDVSPPEIIVKKASSLIVDVLCISVIYETYADDGFQWFRTSGCYLKRIEA